MSKHTPGPWFAENDGDQWQVWHNEGIAHIADVSGGVKPDPTGEANAHLIAAAPELLAVAEYALEVSDKWGALHQMATAAIAKARGEP